MTASPSRSIRIVVPALTVLLLASLFLWYLPRGARPGSEPPPPKAASETGSTVGAPAPPPRDPGPETPSDAALTDRFVLRGRVLNRLDDTPIEGAGVVARDRGLRFDHGSRWNPKAIARTTSDDRGGFAFPKLRTARERVNLVVTRPGFVSYVGHRSVWDRGPDRVIRLAPGVVITGEVVFEDGSPVPGGHVEIHDQLFPAREWMLQENPDARFYTPGGRVLPLEPHGRFTITVDAAMVALDAQGDTFAPAFSPILFPSPDEENHVVIRVARGQTLQGTVRAPDGSPIAGASSRSPGKSSRRRVKAWLERWFPRCARRA